MKNNVSAATTWLAWWWAFWLGLTLLKALTPLRFTSVAIRSVVHCAAWLPAFYFVWQSSRPVLRAVAGLQLGLLVVPLVVGGVYGFEAYPKFFFATKDPGYDAYYEDLDLALFHRGAESIYSRHVVYDQNDPTEHNPGNYNKLVVVRSLLPGLAWQSPLPTSQRLDATWVVTSGTELEFMVPIPRLRTLMPVGWVGHYGTVAVATPPAAAGPTPPSHYAFNDQIVDLKEPVYSVLEQMPTLPGGSGKDAILAAVKHRLAPLSPAADSGVVFISFIVRRTGRISDVRIIHSLDPVADATVLAALDELPPFTPGQRNGQPASVAYGLMVPVAPPKSGR